MTKIKLTPHVKTQVENRHIELRNKGTLLDASYNLQVLPEKDPCKTGCWTYKDGRHEIMLSPLAYDTVATPSLGEGVRKDVPGFFKAVYEHEAAHSKYTTKDLKGLNALLIADKIPWRLFNLFEDARIERMWEYRMLKKFNWMKWEKYPADISKVTPTALFYFAKASNHGRSGRLPRAFFNFFRVLPFFNKVVKYYYEAINLAGKTSEHLIPVIKRWLEDFPKTSDDSIVEAGGLGTGDLKDAMTCAGESAKDVKAGEREGGKASKEGEKKEGSSEKGGVLKASVGEGGGLGEVSGLDSELHTETPMSEPEIKEARMAVKLARMLDFAFKGTGVMKAATAAPSKKLNLRSILRKCYDLPYIGKTIGSRGAPHISLLIDCSSSMSGASCFIDRDRRNSIRVSDAGRVLLHAISMLAKRGRLTGEVYLCASGGVNWRGNLPLRNALDLKRFGGFSSSEGFGMALRPDKQGSYWNCFKEVSKHKLAICYTDGCITDKPIDKVALRQRGVHTLGLCCSADDRTPALKNHFDSAISRDSLWSLADALVRFLRSRTF